MNSIRQIQELNKRELENGISPEASWHVDYRDTAYIYIGGLPFEFSEGDIITIFSQFGEPTYINLIRDKETGKSKGFAFLKYEDQRSTDLAVDNLGGAVVMGRTLKVDHTRYKKKDDELEEGHDLTAPTKQIGDDDGKDRRKRRRTDESESEEERPMIKEERELAKLIQEHDEDDPMKAFLIEEKKEEVALALAQVKNEERTKHKRTHRHHHRSRQPKEGDEEPSRGKSRRRDDHGRGRARSRDRTDPHKEERLRKDEPWRDRAVEIRNQSRSREHGDRESYRKAEHPRRRNKDISVERQKSYHKRDSFD